nr:MAG TPA: hypothetical protein [Caudoviricetes sp.]
MDKIKFDDELVDIDKVKSLIIYMLNKSERIPYVDFKSDNLELCPDELEYKYTYADNELSTIFYKILIDKELSSVFPHSVSVINNFDWQKKIRLAVKVIVIYNMSINDEHDEYYDINGKYFNYEIIEIGDIFSPSDIMKGDTNGSI